LSRQQRRLWQALARPLELRPGRDGDRLIGERGGRSLQLVIGASSARLVVSVTERLPPGTHLSSENRRPRLKLARLQDIQVGEREVDDALVVQASNPAAIIRLLRDDGVRRLFPDFFVKHPSAVVVDQELVLTLDSPDEAAARSLVAEACRLADALDAALAQQREAAEGARASSLAQLPPERPRPPLALGPNPHRITVEKFRRLQAWFLGTSVLPVATGWMMVAAANQEWIRAQWTGPGAAIFVAGFVGGLVGSRYFRCPACGGSLAGEDGINPFIDRCPVCMAHLR